VPIETDVTDTSRKPRAMDGIGETSGGLAFLLIIPCVIVGFIFTWRVAGAIYMGVQVALWSIWGLVALHEASKVARVIMWPVTILLKIFGAIFMYALAAAVVIGIPVGIVYFVAVNDPANGGGGIGESNCFSAGTPSGSQYAATICDSDLEAYKAKWGDYPYSVLGDGLIVPGENHSGIPAVAGPLVDIANSRH
jgi:hypothetical protein